MAKLNLSLFYATNRRHEGASRFQPDGYGTAFSADGMENLRFGRVAVEVETAAVNALLKKKRTPIGPGAGEDLAKHLSDAVKAGAASIQAYEESIPGGTDDPAAGKVVLGSQAMFSDLKSIMDRKSDVLVYIHGFNVTWAEAVGYALALQLMLNSGGGADARQEVAVVLFTWPSDGQAKPWLSYKSDRAEAAGSSGAFARGLLKLRDFLADLRDRAKDSKVKLCEQDIHLLCHSMGNFVLQNTLPKLDDFTPGDAFPRL
ncbi:MAG: alpha/beta hydrolase, partial [Opitutaceae bacterium]|nr:alpha/beta hydrolase [Opitutaceae bacterium]